VNTFCYVIVASPLHDAATVERVTADVRKVLGDLGGERVDELDGSVDGPLAILVATGGTEAAILDIVRRRHLTAPFEPVVLVTHRLHNSLPAALEALARVRADGGHGRIVQIGEAGGAALATVIADVAAIHQLHRTRLGLVGEPSPWLVASVPDSDQLRSRWGVEIVPIDIGGTIRAFSETSPRAAHDVAVHFSGSKPPTAELVKASTLHPVLVDAMHAAHVDAVAVRCFDYLGELCTSGCIALAELNDSGIVAGCEGDVASAVAMLLVRALFDQPSWMANPASIDDEDDCILLAHCTVAPSLVGDIELHTHFESGIGVGLRGRFDPGPVTLLRLGGRGLDRIWVADGAVESTGDADDLCRTQVMVRIDPGRAASLLDAPLGNHILLFLGHHRDRIERWWHLAFGE